MNTCGPNIQSSPFPLKTDNCSTHREDLPTNIDLWEFLINHLRYQKRESVRHLHNWVQRLLQS